MGWGRVRVWATWAVRAMPAPAGGRLVRAGGKGGPLPSRVRAGRVRPNPVAVRRLLVWRPVVPAQGWTAGVRWPGHTGGADELHGVRDDTSYGVGGVRGGRGQIAGGVLVLMAMFPTVVPPDGCRAGCEHRAGLVRGALSPGQGRDEVLGWWRQGCFTRWPGSGVAVAGCSRRRRRQRAVGRP
jgi:hypothetical protein